MTETSDAVALPRSARVLLVAFVLIGGALLAIGRRSMIWTPAFAGVSEAGWVIDPPNAPL